MMSSSDYNSFIIRSRYQPVFGVNRNCTPDLDRNLLVPILIKMGAILVVL